MITSRWSRSSDTKKLRSISCKNRMLITRLNGINLILRSNESKLHCKIGS